MANLNTFNFDHMVSEREGKPVTTSFQIAEYFGKQHKHVLRDIKNLDCSEEFTKSNFGLCFKNNVLQNGKKQIYYIISKDGFMFLAMGYRGKKASELKENYIKAFNWMHEQLTNISKSYMEMLNKAMLQFKQEQSIASYAGKTLRQWQDSKPILERKINEIASKSQLKLEIAS